ncbi:uncharacterized protein AMSG_02165 [Thecamonas trahens ATCC 50062]|uniref:RanBP2-type domain-containing protein n=1 Tax=Thecamonas trahens ATCC 50062 TaxID=461836 RepID=A0A0L0DV31_THETB|nr:hypothetical protein AMSG_02165 [Thecamonas trahens ATCC 50062]KNC56149.1 hypothetical protein AMSG_02165 [Thecamonas trahens ATCC 50062]|eukprot:XP_013761186.1 hypothetical protein AMSG_02165 [Thecamonas trahens ATCC 50062]
MGFLAHVFDFIGSSVKTSIASITSSEEANAELAAAAVVAAESAVGPPVAPSKRATIPAAKVSPGPTVPGVVAVQTPAVAKAVTAPAASTAAPMVTGSSSGEAAMVVAKDPFLDALLDKHLDGITPEQASRYSQILMHSAQRNSRGGGGMASSSAAAVAALPMATPLTTTPFRFGANAPFGSGMPSTIKPNRTLFSTSGFSLLPETPRESGRGLSMDTLASNSKASARKVGRKRERSPSGSPQAAPQSAGAPASQPLTLDDVRHRTAIISGSRPAKRVRLMNKKAAPGGDARVRRRATAAPASSTARHILSTLSTPLNDARRSARAKPLAPTSTTSPLITRRRALLRRQSSLLATKSAASLKRTRDNTDQDESQSATTPATKRAKLRANDVDSDAVHSFSSKQFAAEASAAPTQAAPAKAEPAKAAPAKTGFSISSMASKKKPASSGFSMPKSTKSDAAKPKSSGGPSFSISALAKKPKPAADKAGASSDETWKCMACTMDNKKGIAACATCTTPNPAAKKNKLAGWGKPAPAKAADDKAGASSDETWKCMACTMDNKKGIAACATCTTPNPAAKKNKLAGWGKPAPAKAADDKAGASSDETWKCMACTMDNKKGIAACATCTTPNPAAKKNKLAGWGKPAPAKAADDKAGASSDETWKCMACTMDNKKGIAACATCTTPNPAAKKNKLAGWGKPAPGKTESKTEDNVEVKAESKAKGDGSITSQFSFGSKTAPRR